MELIEKNTDRARKRKARKKVEALKGFYGHLSAYLIVNTVLTAFTVIGSLNNGVSFGEAFLNFGTFSIWFFWGIGLFFHAMKVFSVNPFFGKDWEERQIQKYMKKERDEATKYN